MTTVHITLPDDLAQKADHAGLLSAEAMEAMLREQLQRRAGQSLLTLWEQLPEELSLETAEEINAEVHSVRARPQPFDAV